MTMKAKHRTVDLVVAVAAAPMNDGYTVTYPGGSHATFSNENFASTWELVDDDTAVSTTQPGPVDEAPDPEPNDGQTPIDTTQATRVAALVEEKVRARLTAEAAAHTEEQTAQRPDPPEEPKDLKAEDLDVPSPDDI